MKIIWLVLISCYFALNLVIGIPISISYDGLSRNAHYISFQTSHETILRLIAKSKLELKCQSDSRAICIRPADYSMLKTNLPIQLEVCQTTSQIPKCDDMSLGVKMTSSNLIAAGLKL